MISRRLILSTVPHPLSRTAPSSAAASKAREARRPWMTLSASEANIEKRLFDCSQMRVSGEKKTEKTKGQRRAAPGAPSLSFLLERASQLVFFPASRSLALSLSFLHLFHSHQRWPLPSSTPSPGWQRRRRPRLPRLPRLRPSRSKLPPNVPRPREASPSSGRRARTCFTTPTVPSPWRR